MIYGDETNINQLSCRVAEGLRSSWLKTLGNQLIDRSPYITEYVNKSQVNACIAQLVQWAV